MIKSLKPVILLVLLTVLTDKLIYGQSIKNTNTTSNREFVNPQDSTVMKKYFMIFLKTGPNRTQPEEEAKQIQDGHLKHISQLAAAGKVILAGPFDSGKDGAMRGLLLFDVDTPEEAVRLASEDPAVKAGRLVIEILPWWSQKGACLK